MLNRRDTVHERFAYQMLAVEVAPAPVLDAAEFQLGVAQHAAGTTFWNRIEAFIIEIALRDVVVAGHPVAIVQLVVKNRIVIPHDPIVGIRITKKLR